MPHPRSFTAHVDDTGRLQPREAARHIAEALQLFSGGRVVVTLDRPTRSLDQNAYLWGVVYRRIREGLLESGQTVSAEALHEYFKAHYLQPQGSCQVGEKEVVIPPSTRNLTTTQFSDYIERIKQDELVLTLGIHIPEAGEDARLAA